MALTYGASLGVSVAVARIFNVYGSHEAPHRLLPTLLRKLGEGQPVALSSGTQVRDFIYADNVAEGLWRIAEGLRQEKLRSGAYNLCTGVGHSVGEFARAVATTGGYDRMLLHFGEIPMRADEVQFLVGDPSALRSAIGWRSRYDLAAGLKAVLNGTSYKEVV